MITFFDKNGYGFIIRPCPLINISWNTTFNEDGPLGGKYDITLTGTILDDGGSPIYSYNQNDDTVAWTPSYYPNGAGSKPAKTTYAPDVGALGALRSILAKQVALRELFARGCAKIEVASVVPSHNEPVFSFYPKFLSINFAEDTWVQKCDYTISLEAEFLLDTQDRVIGSESYASKTFKPGSAGWSENTNNKSTRLPINILLEKIGGFVEDFQESWSVEPEDGQGNTTVPNTGREHTTRVYRITRNISAKGKNITAYECFGTQPPEFYKAHEQARRYVVNHIQNSGTASNHWDDYPNPKATPNSRAHFLLASGILNLATQDYAGYNHSRTENLDITQGTYSVADTWILSSGNSTENYSLSLSTSEGDPTHKVSIEGTIRGLTSIPGSGVIFGGNMPMGNENTSYENAINKYRQITNFGRFGLAAHTYKRAQNAAGGILLNHVPLSVALSSNEFTGEINYTIEYDDRPLNLVNGVLSENVSITDTYPGDVFATIPVIGRPTGPVLQYIGGRTEYQRSLSVELVVPKIQSSNQRAAVLRKPSLVEPTRSGIIAIINSYSPGLEPTIRKYFVAPPVETWDPKSGRYTLNINWTYELSK